MIALESGPIGNGVKNLSFLRRYPEAGAELEERNSSQNGVKADGLGGLLRLALKLLNLLLELVGVDVGDWGSVKGIGFELFQKILNDEVDLGEHDFRSAFRQGEISDVFAKFRGSHVAHHDGAEGTNLLICPDEARFMNPLIGLLLETKDLTRDRCDVEVKEGRQVDMLQNAVTGYELGSLRSSCLIRDNVFHQFVNPEIIVPVVVGNLGEDHLPVVVARTPNGIMLTELFRRKVRGHQGVIRPHDDVEMLFYLTDASIVPLTG